MNEHTSSMSDWCVQVAANIERLAGPAARSEALAAWQEHEARDAVEVTLIGPYSSGKSSLLRRLLADEGIDVPDWCTVSGRRETFELNEIVAGSVSFTDAPGFASTNITHEQLAEDALALSDAFILVVPPNLMTSRLPLAASLLSGLYYFGRPGGELSNKVLAVIAQSDTLGVDPEDDVEGMRELANRKSQELVAQLEDAGAGDLSDLRVLVVAADPYEEQARTRNPSRDSFDAFRDWDGMDDLAAAIKSLAGRRAELREAAKLRYFSRIGRAVVDEGTALLQQSKSAADDLRARSGELAQLRIRGEALAEAAEADLGTRLVSLGTEMAEELSDSDTDAAAKIGDAVAELVERWAARHDAEVDLFLGEAAGQIDRRLDRPAAQHTSEFLRSLVVGESDERGQEVNSRVVRLLNDMHSDVEGVVRKSFEVKMGQSIEKLLKDVEKVKHPKTGGASKTAEGVAAADKMGKAARAAQIADGGLQVAGGVLAIVTTIDAEVRQRRLDEAVREQREKARDELERAAEEFATSVVRGTPDVPGWSARIVAGLNVVRESLGLPEDSAAIGATAAEVQRLVEELEGFRRLLTECPA